MPKSSGLTSFHRNIDNLYKNQMLTIFKTNNKIMMIASTMLTIRTDGGAIANVKDIEAVESDPQTAINIIRGT